MKKGYIEMKKNEEKQVAHFVESVSSFFSEVESWILSSPLKVGIEEIQITEENAGSYKINKHKIQDESDKKVADLVPIGTFIIGANGRIDLNGTIDRVVIVHLEINSPAMTTKVTVGNHRKTPTTYFYKGIEKSGWYWIEDSRRSKAHFMDRKLFCELLKEVSDYELD